MHKITENKRNAFADRLGSFQRNAGEASGFHLLSVQVSVCSALERGLKSLKPVRHVFP